MRKAFKAASVLAMVGGLALGVTTSASAAVSGATNLNGKGCPASYTNPIPGGPGGSYYLQTRTKKFLAANGREYGDYTVYAESGGIQHLAGTAEYTC